MSEKTDKANTTDHQVWKNPAMIKAVSSILTEIITENAKENNNQKIKGILIFSFIKK